MRTILTILFTVLGCFSGFAQENSSLKFILVPHPRSEDKVIQSVLPAIEKIDFTKYDMILLGGDLTYYTSINRTSMDYCNQLFNFSSPNTLWTMGNHDLNNPGLIAEYTGKPRYYSYYRDSITFLVLDTELNSNGFKSSFISGNQLDMIKNVCDTIVESGYLVVLHGRILWMIGNDYFATKIDSVAESTRQMDTTNFYQEVYPLLQKVKAKGIKVICLAGDKSKINMEYSPESDISFYASTMAPEYSDDQNNVMIFTYNRSENILEREFISLSAIPKKSSDNISEKEHLIPGNVLSVLQSPGINEVTFQMQKGKTGDAVIKIYSINGCLCESGKLKAGESLKFVASEKGIYICQAIYANTAYTKRFVVQ